MSHSHTLLQCGSMNASLPHGSMLRYEDNPFFVSSQSATQAASSPRCHAQANSSERISMELEILEAGSRAGHDLSGPHRQGYQQHRATVRPVQPGSSSHRGPYALLGEAFRKPRLHPSSSESQSESHSESDAISSASKISSMSTSSTSGTTS